MAEMTHSYKGFLGLGAHATSLTSLRAAKVARTVFSRFHDLEVTHAQGEEDDPTSGRADPEGAAPGNYDVRLRGTLEGTTEGVIPYLLRSLLGGQPTTTVVGTTGRQHVFELADNVPLNGGRLSYEVRYGTDAESEIGNMACDMLEFNITRAGYARWGFSALGSSPEYLAAPSVPTLPSMATILAQRVTTFTLNAETTAVVRGLTWRLRRDRPDSDYDVTSRQRRDASLGGMETSMEADVTFESLKHWRQFMGSAAAVTPSDVDTYYPVNIKTERSDVIAGGTAKHTAMLDMPKVMLKAVGSRMEGRNGITQRVRGRAFYNPTGSVYAQRVTLINTLAAI